MAEPTSSAAGGVVAWKVAGGVLSIGIVGAVIGFMVLPPKTAREAAVRFACTIAGSTLLGPLLVAAVYSRWPQLFAGGVDFAKGMALEPWLGLFMVAAPLLAVAGLPMWWLLGAAFLWLDRRKGKDLGEMAADARADVTNTVMGVKTP